MSTEYANILSQDGREISIEGSQFGACVRIIVSGHSGISSETLRIKNSADVGRLISGLKMASLHAWGEDAT